MFKLNSLGCVDCRTTLFAFSSLKFIPRYEGNKYLQNMKYPIYSSSFVLALHLNTSKEGEKDKQYCPLHALYNFEIDRLESNTK